MPPIFEVMRDPEDWKIVDKKKLPDGDHIIGGDKVQVPITVDGSKVTVHVGQATGNLSEATMDGTGDDWTLADRGDITDITVDTGIKGSRGVALQIFSDSQEDGNGVLIERHEG